MIEQAHSIAFKKGFNPIAVISRDGHWIVVNEAYCKLLEYSELELLKKRFQDVTDPDDVHVDEQESERVARGDIESYEMIKRYITKTKHLVHVRLRVDAVRDEDGRFLCFVAQCVPLEKKAQYSEGSIDIKTAKIITWLHKNAKWILIVITGLASFAGFVIKEYFALNK